MKMNILLKIARIVPTMATFLTIGFNITRCRDCNVVSKAAVGGFSTCRCVCRGVKLGLNCGINSRSESKIK